MAEERPKAEAGEGAGHQPAGHGEGHAGPPPAEHHIQDKVLISIDAEGRLVRPYDQHGNLKAECAGYVPAMVGPFRLEFTKHMAGFTVAALLVFAVSMLTARRVLAALREHRAPRGPLANAVEGMVVFVRDEMVIPMGGHHLGHYTPLFITYFFLILTCNFLGLIPDFGSSTGNFSVTAALGGSVYLLVWVLGLKNQGLKYLVHLVPPGTPWWLWPGMFVLELIGPAIKCFVLCVRLFANMIAGHLIIGNIINLGVVTPAMLIIGLPLCLGLSFLEVLVCVIQAYVFTLLAAIFIGGAVHPEH